MPNLPKDFIELCHSVTAKRPKTVIDHILENGFITTEELKETYGYNHPPRAVRDVREHGISIETFSDASSESMPVFRYANMAFQLKLSGLRVLMDEKLPLIVLAT
jgi:hypothetical protein